MIKKEEKQFARNKLGKLKIQLKDKPFLNASILKDIDLCDITVEDAKAFCIKFNYVFQKETDEYKPFDNKRRFSYRSMARVFDDKKNRNNSTFSLAEFKYFIKMMFFAENNPETAWIDSEVLCPLIEYMASRCNDIDALMDLRKLPFRTIENSRLEMKRFDWFRT